MPEPSTEADTVRASWKISLGLSLSLLASRGFAEEVQWRSAGTPAAEKAIPAAVLDRPVASRAAAPGSDSAVRTVSYSAADATLSQPTFRLQMPDIPKPMPGANGKEKTGDKSSDLPRPREMRETI